MASTRGRGEMLTAAASPSSAALLVRALDGAAASPPPPPPPSTHAAGSTATAGSTDAAAPAVLMVVDGADEAEDADEAALLAPDSAGRGGGDKREAPRGLARLLSRRSSSGGASAGAGAAAEPTEAEAAAAAAAAEAAGMADDSKGWLMPYWRLLRSNREYRVLFIGNIISGLGDWFNIIASLSVLNSADGSALALAFYTAINSLPALVLGPLIGVVTDRYDKKMLMIVSLIVRALTVVGLIFCQTPATLPGMYVLTFVKYTFSAVYQPARTAVVPAVVTKRQLVLANGLDGIVWSCMLFVGGAAGGFATTLFGITTAYVLDGVAYLCAAYVIGFLLVKGGPFLPFQLLTAWAGERYRALADWTRGRRGGARSRVRYGRMAATGNDDSDDELGLTTGAAADASDDPAAAAAHGKRAAAVLGRPGAGEDDDEQDAARSFGVTSASPAAAAAGAPGSPIELGAVAAARSSSTPSTPLDGVALTPLAASEDADLALEDIPVAAITAKGAAETAEDAQARGAAEMVGVAASARQSSWRMIVDGFKYMWAVRYVFAICFYKGTLNLGLGIVDMMNVRSAQTVFAIGDNGALSVGINYMITGTGTIIQPILIRRFVKQTPRTIQYLLLGALLQLALGATALFFSREYHWFILSNLFRSGSTSIGLIYSSLVLQQVVPAPLRGRVFSFEQTITTVCNVASRVLAGVAIDTWGWSIFQVDGLAALLTVGGLIAWAIYFSLSRKHVAIAYKTDDVSAPVPAAAATRV